MKKQRSHAPEYTLQPCEHLEMQSQVGVFLVGDVVACETHQVGLARILASHSPPCQPSFPFSLFGRTDGRTDGRADGVSRVALIAVAAVHNRGERRRGKKWSHERNRTTFARCDSTVGRTSSGAVRARAVAWRGITTRRRQASATQHCGDFLLLEVPRRDFIST